jgi:excinuclease ABC subunit A
VTVVGARQHNLKDLTVSFPRDRMTVCTGVSGSGKTSFAIDTVFTEGYRRYVESLSAYARQFLGQMAKPRVDHVEGLSPAICIEQRAAGKSPRSTVGTVTEIYDYMRVLWARVGRRFCPHCQVPIGTQTADEIVERVMAIEAGTPIVILAPIGLGDGETYAGLFNRLKSSGYLRVRIDGEIRATAEATTLDARRKHRVEVVVDRTVVRSRSRARITESVEHALALGNGVMTLVVEEVETVEESHEATEPRSHEATKPRSCEAESEAQSEPQAPPRGPSEREAAASASAKSGRAVELQVKKTPAREFLYSQKLVCTACGVSYEELGPNHFSFNSQLGWCETCEGLGVQRGAPAGAIIERPNRSLFDGAVAGWYRIDRRSPLGRMLTAFCEHVGVTPDAPLRTWTPEQKRALMFGTKEWLDASGTYPGARVQWRGFFPTIDHATRNSWAFRYKLRNVVTDIPCVTCRGGRLRPDAAAVRLGDSEARLANSEEAGTVRSELHAPAPGQEGIDAAPPNARPSPCPLPRRERDSVECRRLAGREGAALRGRTIVEVCEMPLDQCAEFFRDLELDDRERKIAGELLKEIRDRLQFLIDVGLQYLTLHRAAPTLSGGEAQRIRLASQIGSGLSGVLYVLDEPTIGLHPRDTARLIAALTKLRNLGNTLLLVEHDRDVIRSADRLLDFGPRAGAAGGRVVAEGPPAEFLRPPPSDREAPASAQSEPGAQATGPSKRAAPASAKPLVRESLLAPSPMPLVRESLLAPSPIPTATAGPEPDHGHRSEEASAAILHAASGAEVAAESLTRAYLSAAAAIPIPSNRRPVELPPEWRTPPAATGHP